MKCLNNMITWSIIFDKAIRKLTEQRRHVEKRKEKRNIISEYTNFDSQVYAPMTRIGVFLDADSEQYHVKSQYTSTLEGDSMR